MKTKELIRLLILTDPDGEAEVCVDNDDIVRVDDLMPCYYDGQFVQIVTDSTAVTDYNVYGVTKVVSRTQGSKIKLRTLEPSEAFLENPEAEFVMEPYNPDRENKWKISVEEWREQGRELYHQMDEDLKKINSK